MWYVIQTITGKEGELISLIETILNKKLYSSCFVIKAEWMKRLGGEWQIQVRPLFPGYIFIDTKQPEQVFEELKKVPRFSKMLGNAQFEFIPVQVEEQHTLELLLEPEDTLEDLSEESGERIIGLSEIFADEQGKIKITRGALKQYENNILRVDFHKRYAVVNTRILGKDRTLLFGFRLEKDK